jgi:hypothetical protein
MINAGGVMRRSVLFAMVLVGLSLLILPALNASGEDWKEVKTKAVLLGKTECKSGVLKYGNVGGDFINLPVEGGKGLPVKVSPQKVLVDKDGKGKFDFTAAQGAKSTVFEVKLVYGEGETAKHWIQILKNGNGWVFARANALEANLDGTKVWLLDDNNNGIYGEEGADGLYIDRKEWGAPLSHLVYAGGKLFEIEVNQSGSLLKYRPYAGTTGKVDIFKEWTGSKNPQAVIVQGSTQSGKVYLDISDKGEMVVPTGTFNLMSAHMEGVDIRGGQKTAFEVGEGATATMKWGLKLEVFAAASVDRTKNQYTLSPVPKVTGIGGEEYLGSYMTEDPRFKFEVQQATANGKPVGRETTWAICFS